MSVIPILSTQWSLAPGSHCPHCEFHLISSGSTGGCSLVSVNKENSDLSRDQEEGELLGSSVRVTGCSPVSFSWCKTRRYETQNTVFPFSYVPACDFRQHYTPKPIYPLLTLKKCTMKVPISSVINTLSFLTQRATSALKHHPILQQVLLF